MEMSNQPHTLATLSLEWNTNTQQIQGCMGHRAIMKILTRKILTRKILTIQGFKPQIIQPTAPSLYCAISLTFLVTNGKCIADKIKYRKDYFHCNITTNTYGMMMMMMIIIIIITTAAAAASHHIQS
jgi:hypothetical protein